MRWSWSSSSVSALAWVCLGALCALQSPQAQDPLDAEEAAAQRGSSVFEPLEQASRELLLFGYPARLEQAPALRCGACHAAIVEEWARSTHALAWVSPHYQQSLVGKQRPESCHGCHIPEPLHLGDLGGKPSPRAPELEAWHLGISCESCHAGPGNSLLGPWGAPTLAHDSKQHESFLELGSNALCISCHRTSIGPVIGIAKDFELGGMASKGFSCVGCHMHPLERSHSLGDDGLPSAPRPGRSHLLSGPRDPGFLSQAFLWEALPGPPDATGQASTLLRLSNNAAHRVPGLESRVFDFELSLEDAAGVVLSSASLRLSTREPLLLGKVREITLPGAGSSVRLRGTQMVEGLAQAQVFLERRLPVIE